MCPRSKKVCWLVISAGLIIGSISPAPAQSESAPTTPQAPAKPTETPAPRPSETPAAAPTAPAEPTTPYDASDVGAGAVTSFDSAVGYIDSAVPSNLFRLRVDAAYRSNRSTRAEFFYAKGGPTGPGLPLVEPNDDYQEISGYLEGLVAPNLSVFLEAPFRMLNPEVNSDHEGFGDLNAGFKYAFISSEDLVTSFQLRVYAPTGNARLGLGTRHTSVEPALLSFFRLSDKLRLESELRLWVPIGGTDFAGDIVRYGIGFSYGERPKDDWWLTPVVEVVGWTVLSGKEQVAFAPPPQVEDATGDTIVNLKLGVRVGFGDRFDIYSGYGRALTGWVWYKDIWRTELRLAF